MRYVVGCFCCCLLEPFDMRTELDLQLRFVLIQQVKRAFLHYDFPDFSTGVIKSKGGSSANRRGK